MRTLLWQKGKTSHGSSVDWSIFEEGGKIFIDSHSGWVSEVTLTSNNTITLNPLNPTPNYVQAKAKAILKNRKKFSKLIQCVYCESVYNPQESTACKTSAFCSKECEDNYKEILED